MERRGFFWNVARAAVAVVVAPAMLPGTKLLGDPPDTRSDYYRWLETATPRDAIEEYFKASEQGSTGTLEVPRRPDPSGMQQLRIYGVYSPPGYYRVEANQRGTTYYLRLDPS